MAAENHIGTKGQQRLLRHMRPSQAPAMRYHSRQHVVMEDRHPHAVVRSGLEHLPHPFDLTLGEMALHRGIVGIEGERSKGDAVSREHASDHQTIDLEYRSQVFTEIDPVLLELGAFAQHPKRAAPPLGVMVAWNDVQRGDRGQRVEIPAGRLELSVSAPLADIARNDDGPRSERGKKLRQDRELSGIGATAEMRIGDVRDYDIAYQMTRTR